MKQPSHPNETVRELLGALRRRQRLVNAAEFAARGLLFGACLSALGGLIRLIGGGDSSWLSPVSLLLLMPSFALLGACLGCVHRMDDLRIARALDSAAKSEDRFASAIELGGHHRTDRVSLISRDALSVVNEVSVQAALPVRMSRELKLLPLPAVLFAFLLWLGSVPRLDATVQPAPEISAEQWTELSKEFRDELSQLPQPQTPDEKELARSFEKLASLLEKQPQSKEVFEEIARLRAKLESRRQGLPGQSLSMRNAARAVKSSGALKPFADQLKAGDYAKAAESLNALATGLRDGSQTLSAEQFEQAGSDFERLAKEIESSKELGNACKNCAGAASSMNNRKLADAMSELSKQLRKNADNLRECDKLNRSCKMLDQLQRRMNQCKSCSSCKNGKCGMSGQCSSRNGSSFVRRSNNKGGRGAGWGTADQWQGGQMGIAGGERSPVMAEIKEGAGRQSTLSTVQRDERAESAMAHKEMYAEYVQKAEADLSLESVPVAYREFLKRYFESIQPEEPVTDEDSGK